MIQNVLQNSRGIEMVGILSILLFFACFVGVVIWTFRLKKSYLDSVSQLPLTMDSEPQAGSASAPQTDSRHE
jgi:cytochrome c oxidase cbb3-type subunit IV